MSETTSESGQRVRNPYHELLEREVPKDPWEREYDLFAGLLHGKFPSNEQALRLARHALVLEYSWAIPNEEALELLASLSPLVEIGAGGGYWSWCLRERGATVVPYDLNPPPVGNHQATRVWRPVSKGGPRKLRKHADCTLLLCWPPYNNPCAEQCLDWYEGDRIAYVGEWGGCTATEAFHARLEAEWSQTHKVELPRWFGLHDHLTVWERKHFTELTVPGHDEDATLDFLW